MLFCVRPLTHSETDTKKSGGNPHRIFQHIEYVKIMLSHGLHKNLREYQPR